MVSRGSEACVRFAAAFRSDDHIEEGLNTYSHGSNGDIIRIDAGTVRHGSGHCVMPSMMPLPNPIRNRSRRFRPGSILRRWPLRFRTVRQSDPDPGIASDDGSGGKPTWSWKYSSCWLSSGSGYWWPSGGCSVGLPENFMLRCGVCLHLKEKNLDRCRMNAILASL